MGSIGKNVSRRTFLTGAALAGATAAAAGLVGCAAEPSGASAANAGAADGSPAPDLAIEAVSLADAGDPARTCDYLVIGGGNCGMMSAAHAGSLGLATILLEKSSVTGGSSVGTEVTMAFSDCKIMQECADDPNVVNMSQQTGTPNDIYTYFMMHNSGGRRRFVSNTKNNHRQHDFLLSTARTP
ncbi:MAG: FAD-binding protein [Eggerthellaceae bacterium]